MAGPWDRWRDLAIGENALSCTIIVGAASAWMAAYHDRMPVLIRAMNAHRQSAARS